VLGLFPPWKSAFNAVTRELLAVTNTTVVNTETMCELLREIASQGLVGPVTLVLDNARYQRNAVVQALADALNIELLFLPPYSPNLNLPVSCGLDRMGRVVVERRFNRYGFYETFYDWSSEPLEAAHFDYSPEKRPINLLVVQMDGGRARASCQSATHGTTLEAYRWVGPLVREVEVPHAVRADGRLSPMRPRHTARADYDVAAVDCPVA
jgi:transposase